MRIVESILRVSLTLIKRDGFAAYRFHMVDGDSDAMYCDGDWLKPQAYFLDYKKFRNIKN
jgi:hypothetical protein